MSTAVMTRESVRALFDKQKLEIARALPQHVDSDTFIRVFLTAINKTPKLLECSQPSLMQSAMDLAQLGLVADSVMGLAYLIPFNDSKRGMICQLIIGYQGYIELAYRSPKVKAIRWNVVHAKDRFDYVDGFEPRLVHTPCDDEDPGPLVSAYAVCRLDGGEMTYAVLNRREVMKAKASSRGANSDYSPWTLWEEPMWAKTAVKAMLKRVPKSRDLELAYTRDAEDAVIDVQSTAAMSVPVLAMPKEEESARAIDGAAAVVEEPPVVAPATAATPEPAKPAAKKKEGKPAPATDLFVESDEHKMLRDAIKVHGITEAALLEHLRGPGLIDDTVSDIKMIPQKRVATILAGIETIIAELK